MAHNEPCDRPSEVPSTASDLARADRMLARSQEGDTRELAKELASFRAEILSCAVVRVEREFNVKERKR